MVATAAATDGPAGPGDRKPARRNRTIDDLYRQSSQFRMWSFTPDSLDGIKHATNQTGRQTALEKYNEVLALLVESEDPLYRTHAPELAADKLLELLSLDEETKYINFYCKNIVETANFFRMPTQVKATAVSFFRRFYLVHSAMEFHPKNIMYTCVFLAAKLENYFISINSFTKALRNTQNSDILDLEFTILEALHFTLLVHHAFRPLYGFFLDFQAVLLNPEPRIRGLTADKIASFYDRAKEWVMNRAMMSDVPFLYTPPQVALAAAYATDPNITETYLRAKFEDKPAAEDEGGVQIKKEPGIKEERRGDNDLEMKEVPLADDAKAEEEPHSKEDCSPLTFEALFSTIKQCASDAQVPDSTVEENKAIDRKCYFALRPQKLIEKRIKRLTEGERGESNGAN